MNASQVARKATYLVVMVLVGLGFLSQPVFGQGEDSDIAVYGVPPGEIELRLDEIRRAATTCGIPETMSGEIQFQDLVCNPDNTSALALIPGLGMCNASMVNRESWAMVIDTNPPSEPPDWPKHGQMMVAEELRHLCAAAIDPSYVDQVVAGTIHPHQGAYDLVDFGGDPLSEYEFVVGGRHEALPVSVSPVGSACPPGQLNAGAAFIGLEGCYTREEWEEVAPFWVESMGGVDALSGDPTYGGCSPFTAQALWDCYEEEFAPSTSPALPGTAAVVPGLIYPPYGDQSYEVRDISPRNNSWGIHGNRSYRGIESWLGTDFISLADTRYIYAPFSGTATSGTDPNGGNWVAITGEGGWQGWFVRYIHLESEGRATGHVNVGDQVGVEGSSEGHTHLILLYCGENIHQRSLCQDVPILTLIPQEHWPDRAYVAGTYTERFAPGDAELAIPEGAVSPNWDNWPGGGRPIDGDTPVVLDRGGQILPGSGQPSRARIELNQIAGILGVFFTILLAIDRWRMKRRLKRLEEVVGITSGGIPGKHRKLWLTLLVVEGAAIAFIWAALPAELAATREFLSRMVLICWLIPAVFVAKAVVLAGVRHFTGWDLNRPVDKLLGYTIWITAVPYLVVWLAFSMWTGGVVQVVQENIPEELAGIFPETPRVVPIPVQAGDAPDWQPLSLTWWNKSAFVLDIPQDYWQDIWDAGVEEGVDPAYLACLGSSESQVFWRNETICSSAGACGPYQFMPGTWQTFQPWPGASRTAWPDAAFGAARMVSAYEFDEQPTMEAHRLRFTGRDTDPPSKSWNNHDGQADYVWVCTQAAHSAMTDAGGW